MKKFIVPIICIISITLVAINHSKIVRLATDFFTDKKDLIILSGNEYTKNNDYLYVQKSTKYVPLGYQDVLNIFYSIINNHWDTFTFYCPSEYENCVKDITELSNSSETLSNINNFVHPYNSFTNIKTSVDSNGEIIVKVNYLYSKEQIAYINSEVDRILNETYVEGESIEDNLKHIHDYIINTTKYDVDYQNNTELLTYTAYGALKQHIATCNGYTDLMAIFLSKLNINNYKIAYNPQEGENTDGHVWNAVNINGKWLHLDLTWDDPVGDGRDYLYHKYFLVTNEEMNEADNGEVQVKEHNFDRYVYQEF